MVKKEEARKYLCDCAPEQCFWLSNGAILKNLDDFANVLPEMSDEAYGYHVSRDKNDFQKWVADVIGDKKLAGELSSAKNKYSALKKVRSRLISLKKLAS